MGFSGLPRSDRKRLRLSWSPPPPEWPARERVQRGFGGQCFKRRLRGTQVGTRGDTTFPSSFPLVAGEAASLNQKEPTGSSPGPAADVGAEAAGLGFWLSPWSRPSRHRVRIPREGGGDAAVCRHGPPARARVLRRPLSSLGLVFPQGYSEVTGRSH